MKTIVPLLAVMGLALIAYIGTSFLGLHMLFGIVMPYLAFGVFVGGFIFRILDWMKSPVPFRIPTTTGQSKSLEWIKQDQLESPSGFWSAFARVMLEVLFFRSLFRNTKAELGKGPTLVYSSSKWLWFGGLVFHWTMLVIFLRHYRFFLAPIPHVLHYPRITLVSKKQRFYPSNCKHAHHVASDFFWTWHLHDTCGKHGCC